VPDHLYSGPSGVCYAPKNLNQRLLAIPDGAGDFRHAI
jgi:hypothetical protein